jgi:parvulin-like peptidyl-prolyl isomerase
MAHFLAPSSGSVSIRNFLKLSTAFLVAAAFVTTACHRGVTDPHDPKFIVAEKGTWKITRADLDAEIAAFLKQNHATEAQVGPSKMPLLETQVLRSLVLKQLLLERAAALPLKDVDKDEAAAMETIKQRVAPGESLDDRLKAAGMTMADLKTKIHEEVVINKVLEMEAFKDVEPTEQEINAFYLEHKDQPPISTPAKLRASRILRMVDDKTSPADKAAQKKAIDKARDRVAHGEDFSKVATEVSEDRYSGPKGGDIGYFQRGENEAEFDEVVFNLKPGTLSPVFLTPLGYQFVKVTDSKAAGILSVAETSASIANYLRGMKQSVQVKAYSKKLLDDGKVTFYLKLVDLPTQGADGSPSGADGAAAAPAPGSTPQ